MAKINKAYIVLIFMLIGVMVCQNLAYARNVFCLRVPIGDHKRLRSLVSERARLLSSENIVPAVTPFRENTEGIEIDKSAIKRLIGHLISIRVKSILVMGATGEFKDLPNEKRLEAIKIFAEESNGLLTIFANATGDSEEQTLQNIKTIEKIQYINAIVIAPLFYLETNDKILAHIGRIESSLPLVLYNNPGIHKVPGLNIDPDVVEMCKDRVLAIKDSSGDLDLLSEYARRITTYQGNESQVMQALKEGTRGSVASIGNALVHPQLIFDARRERKETIELQARINELGPGLINNVDKIPLGLKYYLSLLGICSERVALPGKILEIDEKIKIKRSLVGLELARQIDLIEKFQTEYSDDEKAAVFVEELTYGKFKFIESGNHSLDSERFIFEVAEEDNTGKRWFLRCYFDTRSGDAELAKAIAEKRDNSDILKRHLPEIRLDPYNTDRYCLTSKEGDENLDVLIGKGKLSAEQILVIGNQIIDLFEELEKTVDEGPEIGFKDNYSTEQYRVDLTDPLRPRVIFVDIGIEGTKIFYKEIGAYKEVLLTLYKKLPESYRTLKSDHEIVEFFRKHDISRLGQTLASLKDETIETWKVLARSDPADASSIIKLARQIYPGFTPYIPEDNWSSVTLEEFIALQVALRYQVYIPNNEMFEILNVAEEPDVFVMKIDEGSWQLQDYLRSNIWIAKALPGAESYLSVGLSPDWFAIVNPDFVREEDRKRYRRLLESELGLSGNYRSLYELSMIAVIQASKVTEEAFVEAIFESAHQEEIRHAKDSSYTAQRLREDNRTAPHKNEQIISEILKPDSTLHEQFSDIDKQTETDGLFTRLNRQIALRAVIEYSAQLGGIIAEIKKHKDDKREELAYIAFLNFMDENFLSVTLEQTQEDDVFMLTYHNTSVLLFQDINEWAGVSLKLFSADLMELLGAEPGKWPVEKALRMLEEIYSTHFWTDRERYYRLDSEPFKLRGPYWEDTETSSIGEVVSKARATGSDL